MKKFIKGCLISGFILIAVGAVVTTAAFVLGANPVRIARYTEQHFNFLDYGDREINMAGEEFLEEMEKTYPEADKIFIRMAGGAVRLYPAEATNELTIRYNGAGKLHDQWSEEQKSLSVSTEENAECDIYIPSGWTFSSLEADVAGGSFSGTGIRAESAEYSVRGGSLSAVQDYGKTIELDCKAGTLKWAVSGEMAETVEADCKAGNIFISLPEGVKSSDCGYELEWDAGNIRFPDGRYTGSGETTLKGKEGAPTLYLHVKAGNITVEQ